MSSKIQRVLTEEKIVTVVTTVTEEDRYVDYADLLECVKIEPDDHSYTPWYESGWESWYVCAEYNGYEAMGCGGIDDYGYADTEVRAECANELAHALEADGFIVTGKPDTTAEYWKNRRFSISRKVHIFDWR